MISQLPSVPAAPVNLSPRPGERKGAAETPPPFQLGFLSPGQGERCLEGTEWGCCPPMRGALP
jgi:hypothetical protein